MEDSPNHHHEPPRVYCQPLHAYNNGQLCGRWLIAAVEDEELWMGVNATLAASPIPDEEEFGWFDAENWHGLRIHEYMPVETVAALGRLVLKHNGAFAAFYTYDESRELEDIEEAFEDAYIGDFDDEAEMGHHIIDEMHNDIPEWLVPYVDGEKYLRDLSYNGDLYTVERDGRVFGFWTR